MIELKNISCSYPSPTDRTMALCSLTETIQNGIITAVIGHTGSGKSTLIEIIGGITSPSDGTVTVDGKPIDRTNIGIVFQNPEYQLFANTVYEDIAFGPKNLGISEAELDERVKSAAELTGLTASQLAASPFSLSGGQMRMAAIAGVIAMNPSVLLLDEPAAGLDPYGRHRVFSLMQRLLESDPDMTIVFVTHSMDDAARYAQDIILLDKGSVAAHGTPQKIFSDEECLKRCGLCAPQTIQISAELRSHGIDMGMPLTAEEAFTTLTSILKGGKNHAS